MTWLGATEIECAPSGNPYDYLHPSVDEIELTDMALSLSQTCRFGGFARPFQPVTSHCILVADILFYWGAPNEIQAAGLLHDGHEAWCGDMPRPMKASGVKEYEALTAIADQAIGERFQIDPALFHLPVVKEADILALFHEGAERMPKGPAGIETYDDLPGELTVRTESMEQSRWVWLALARTLLGNRVD